MFLKKIFFVLIVFIPTQMFAQQQTTDSLDLYSQRDSLLELDTNTKYFFYEEDYIDSLPIYEARFGKDKKVPDSLKLPFYVALSYYPELYHSKIKMEARILFTTMEARPGNTSVFRWAKNRTYNIYINNRKGKTKGINLAKLNFNSRVGFFGHELAHLLSYQFKNSFQLIGMGAKYIFSRKYKRYVERETDMETIRRGLGFALYEAKKRILKDRSLGTSRAYRRNARKNYMTDAEVLQSIYTIGLNNIAYHKIRKH